MMHSYIKEKLSSLGMGDEKRVYIAHTAETHLVIVEEIGTVPQHGVIYGCWEQRNVEDRPDKLVTNNVINDYDDASVRFVSPHAKYRSIK